MVDEIRLRIFRLMINSGEEICLCEMVYSLLVPQAKLSDHLKVLRQAEILFAQRKGQRLYYNFVPGTPF